VDGPNDAARPYDGRTVATGRGGHNLTRRKFFGRKRLFCLDLPLSIVVMGLDFGLT